MTLSVESHPGFLLYDTARLLRRCLGQALHDLQLSESQWRVLGVVSRIPGVSQTEVAALLGINKPPLGNLVDRLEADGLLLRRPDPLDRRRNQLFPGPHSSEVMDEIRQRYGALWAEMSHGIDPEALASLEDVLRQIFFGLHNMNPAASPLPVDQLQLSFLVGAVSRQYGRLFNRALKQQGITRLQWLVLAAIARQERLSQQALCRHLQINKVALGQQLDQLENNGWIERRVNDADRRARSLKLTGQASGRLRQLSDGYERVHAESLSGVDTLQRQRLAQTLEQLRQNLRAIAGQQTEPMGKAYHE